MRFRDDLSTRFLFAPQLKRECIVLGNGPSAEEALNLPHLPTFGCNYLITTPLADKLNLTDYVLLDSLFWKRNEIDMSVWSKLYDRGGLRVHIPHHPASRYFFKAMFGDRLDIRRFHMFPAYHGPLRNLAYRTKLIGPACHNVLGWMIMFAINQRYERIYIAGADFDGFKSLRVDEENVVHQNDRHFYPSSGGETALTMPQWMTELSRVHRSFHILRQYADSRGAQIINLNPDSMIDAFTKGRYRKQPEGDL